MKRVRRFLVRVFVALLLVLALFSVALVVISRRPQRLPQYAAQLGARLTFEQAAAPGFDDAGRSRMADSAWSMRYFQADGTEKGYLYVGTDNNIAGLVIAALRKPAATLPVQPPQIRRYRPDIAPQQWEVVLDYAEHERPPYLNEGFRAMEVYRSPATGRSYLYAATMAAHNPEVWRSASGEPGSWEKVFTFPDEPKSQIGSVRGMTAHVDGWLYMSTTRAGDIMTDGIGQIWATDGITFTRVVTDGFGEGSNAGITSLASFNGCLYAGTYNPHNGYEVWKLRCLSDPHGAPQRVVAGGGGERRDEAAMSMRVFQDRLYVGSGIPLGFNPATRHGPHGCSVIRVEADDRWSVVVGAAKEHPLSGYQQGFGWYLNSYCWYMGEHAGYLYLGTWDLSRTIEFLGQDAEKVAPAFTPLLNELVAKPQDWGSPVGGDLYRTNDGVRWEPVFLDGLGNPDNHGIRTLQSTPLGFFIGTENPFSRLEIWRLVE